MKVGTQYVKLEKIEQERVSTRLLGDSMFGTKLTCVGRLDPYQQQPFMCISGTGYKQLDGAQVYIGDAARAAEDTFRYVLVVKDLLPELTITNEMEE
jgi:hypothetical protein